MKGVLLVSAVVLGLAGCTPRDEIPAWEGLEAWLSSSSHDSIRSLDRSRAKRAFDDITSYNRRSRQLLPRQDAPNTNVVFEFPQETVPDLLIGLAPVSSVNTIAACPLPIYQKYYNLSVKS